MKITKKSNKDKKIPWADNPKSEYYIDDNALYILDSISRGHFSGQKASYRFFVASCQPIEWNQRALIEFLIKVSEEYGLKLKNIETMVCAFDEKYEAPIIDQNTGEPFPDIEKEWKEYKKNYEEYEECKKKHDIDPGDIISSLEKCSFPVRPKRYKGAYKWALDKIKESPETDKSKLLSKAFNSSSNNNDNDFSADDLKRILEISHWDVLWNGLDEEKKNLVKIYNDIVDYTSFEIDLNKKEKKELRKDLNSYLEKFINDHLKIKTRSKYLGSISVSQSSNIYTFSKHKDIFLKKFNSMQDQYGDTFTFKNPVEQADYIEGNEKTIKRRYKERQFLFMHTLFAFEKLNYIKIITLGNTWTMKNSNNLKYFAKVELLPAIKKKINLKFKKKDRLNNISFNEENGTLKVNESKIKNKKFSDQYYVLKIIFNNKSETAKEWFFSEFAEEYDSKADFKNKKFYNAVYQLNKKIAVETGIKGFFITTSKSCKIDPKYIST